MALGNNLNKKKLIPEPDKVIDKSTEPGTEALIPDKKSTQKKSGRSVKVDKKKAVKKTQKPAKPPKKSKDAAPIEKKSNAPTRLKEENVSTVPVTQVTEVSSQSETASHNQIISAYSVFVTQELQERKKQLRKQYIEEVNGLKEKSLQLILLKIGGEKYALDIDSVKEIVPLPTVTATPNTPGHIKGVVNVRGRTFVVFDLAAKFQVKRDEVPRYLLVLKDRKLKASVPLSNLPTTFQTEGNLISHSLQMIEDALLDASYIKGIIRNGQELIYYLDLLELLRNDKAIVVPDNMLKEL